MPSLLSPSVEIPRSSARRSSLDCFFRPRNVAVIGASDGPSSVGRAILANLRQTSFWGAVYPVNPNRQTALGLRCYPGVGDIPERLDLAVIATPARSVPGVIAECVAADVKGAIIISAGFREAGAAGKDLEAEVLREARHGQIRLLGPNCLGLMNPRHGLNATFANSMASQGHIGFISQSGALCTAILDWSHREAMGFSAFVSVGSMLDIGWGDLIQYLGDDPQTRSIVIYMESIDDPRAFLSAAREVALAKPIIVIKPGRTEAAAKAAASHTGALTGHDDVLDAAFRRCGVIRVNTIADLFNLSEALDKQPRPKGPNLTIVTNAGGPAVLATDALLNDEGRLSALSSETIAAMDAVLPRNWSHQNPIDVLGDADAKRYASVMDLAARDSATDGLLVILAPTGLADPVQVAGELAPLLQGVKKPVIASWMGGDEAARGSAILNGANIPVYSYPDDAARIFRLMWSYSANLNALYETPLPLGTDVSAKARDKAAELIANTRAAGRTFLTEAESKNLLAEYQIPTIQTEVATTAGQAVEIATRIGFPVVLKLHSETVTHKTDVGGVRLNLSDSAAVREAWRDIEESVSRTAGHEDFLGVTVQPMMRVDGYELILGSNTDAQFGPVLLFGSGGQLVEVYRDRAIGLPPLNSTLARLLIERTRIFRALRGIRGRPPVDLAELERILVRFSDLVMEQPGIKEIDINPLLASPKGFVALDARIILHPPGAAELPRPAIRPYPVQYIRQWRLKGGAEVTIRPIRPEDESSVARFHARISPQSVHQRFFGSMSFETRVSHHRLVRVCFGDYDREIALVAERQVGARTEIIAVGRLSKSRLTNEAELAMLVEDDYQNQGLGAEISRQLMAIARAENLERLTVETLGENVRMIRLCRKLGFILDSAEAGCIHGTLQL